MRIFPQCCVANLYFAADPTNTPHTIGNVDLSLNGALDIFPDLDKNIDPEDIPKEYKNFYLLTFTAAALATRKALHQNIRQAITLEFITTLTDVVQMTKFNAYISNHPNSQIYLAILTHSHDSLMIPTTLAAINTPPPS